MNDPEHPAGDPGDDTPSTPGPDTQPGPRGRAAPAGDAAPIPGYRIVRVLGQGGMGIVYEAVQEQPRRRVAVKVVRDPHVTGEVLRRFGREADILALLKHAGICQVHDAGRTSAGNPYFAMELVEGRNLLDHADAAGLDRDQRLALASLTCDAIGHAHERGIVHRDLKPENILVTEDGQPKVLDFGIARATEVTAASTMLTGVGHVVGTLEYMSPEQAAGRADLDQRSDVYSLAVVIYELLTGRRPIDLTGLPLPQALDAVERGDIVVRGNEHPALRGDIATILTKSLERDPARRYASAGDLGADIRRLLAHEPVVARPPSATYLLRKFVQRHRLVVTAATAITLALVAGTLMAVRSAALAREAQAVAEKGAYRASLAAAVSAAATGNAQFALKGLDEAPASLRGWEWEHLHALADPGGTRWPLDGPASGLAVASDDGAAFVVAHDGGLRLVRLPLPGLEPDASWPLLGARLSVPREALAAALGPVLEALHAPGSDRESVTFLDAATGDELITVRRCRLDPSLPGRVEPEVAAVSAAGGLAVIRVRAGSDQNAVYDIRSGDVKWLLPGRGRHVAFDASGSRLAWVDYSTIATWDAATGAALWTHRSDAMRLMAVAFSPDGSTVLAGSHSSDGHVRAWDAVTGELLLEREHAGGFDQAWAFSRDGRRCAWSTGAGRVVVFEDGLRQDVAVIEVLRRQRCEVALAGDGQRLVTAGRDGVHAWEIDEPPATGSVPTAGYVYGVSVSPDGARVASASWDGLMRVHSTATRELLYSARMPQAPSGEGASAPEPVPGVTAVDHDASGRWLAFGTLPGVVVVLDARTGRQVAVRRVATEGAVTSLDFHPTRAWLAVTGSGTRIVEVPSLSDAGEVPGTIGQAAWSPDGRYLAAGNAQRHAMIIDAETRAVVARLPGPRAEGFHSIAWSADGSRVVTSAGDGVVRVFGVPGGELVMELEDPGTGRAFGAIFTPDGGRILSGADDGAVRSWDARSGELLAALPGHGWYVYALALDPAGTTLYTGSGDGTMRWWSTLGPSQRTAVARVARARRAEAAPVVDQAFSAWGADAALDRLAREPGLHGEQLEAALQVALLRRQALADAAPVRP